MSIHSISHILASPLGLVLIYLGYNTLTIRNYEYSFWMVIPLTGLVLIYLFKPQIDYWWHTKYPIKFDPELGAFLKRNNVFYAGLEGENKTKFENRLNLYMEAREFKAVGTREMKDIPYDLKALLSAIPIQLTLNDKDFLMGDMDRVFLYKHPFPTPGMKFLHAVETHVEDGVFIFSLEQFEMAEKAKEKYYNVVWYGFVDAFLKTSKTDTSSLEPYANFKVIEGISGFHEKHILSITGLKAIDPMVVLYSLWFTHKERIRDYDVAIHDDMRSYFRKV